jgi:5-dehydro-2-deoxygluconokinase
LSKQQWDASRINIWKELELSSLFLQGVPGFPVEVLNIHGAGDAFSSGCIYDYLQEWDLHKACRMGNASGAQVVLQSGCANFMSYLHESMKFIEDHGGF